MGIWTTIYNLLPDFSGILLAAVGVALVLAPEAVKTLDALPKWRWVIAAILVCLGAAGMRSSFVQHRDSDKKQADLTNSMNEVKKTDGELNQQVETFGPKLDEIIANPESQEQRGLAIALRNELKPKMQIDIPRLIGTDPIADLVFNATETNVGGSLAKAVNNTVTARIALGSKNAEDNMFRYLHFHEDDADKKPMDITPGYAGRTGITIEGNPPITGKEFAHMAADEVLYIGILTSYFDEEGRQYHAEKCVYVDKKNASKFCNGYNFTY